MPYAIDTEKMGELQSMDMTKPPVKVIPHYPFPKCIYLHPKKPYMKQHRVVQGERETLIVPAEHKSKIVQNEQELQAAIEAGWTVTPYIPKEAPDPWETVRPSDIL